MSGGVKRDFATLRIDPKGLSYNLIVKMECVV